MFLENRLCKGVKTCGSCLKALLTRKWFIAALSARTFCSGGNTCLCAIHCSGHWPHMAVERLKCGMTNKLNF